MEDELDPVEEPEVELPDVDPLPLVLLLLPPPVVGADGVVGVPPVPDGDVILTQQLPDGMH